MVTQEEYDLMFQAVRELHVKMAILDTNDNIVDRIEGFLTDGSVTIDNSSSIRRTADSIKLYLKNNFIPSPDSPIWLNRKFKLEIGIRSIKNDQIYYFNLGIFNYDQPQINISLTECTITFRGIDKMAYHDGTYNGKLDMPKTICDIGIPISQAIRTTITGLGHETKYIIEDCVDDNGAIRGVPYKLEKDIGSTEWDIIKELSNLYMWYQCYYDVEGFFRYEKYKYRLTDPIIWDFSDYDFRITSQTIDDFQNVRNIIKVYGGEQTDGTQPSAIARNDDATNKYSTVNIGERIFPISESKYYTIAQCLDRANYELFLHSNLNEKISISCLPIYLINEVNTLIKFNVPAHNLKGVYMIDKISYPLKIDGTMSIDAHKIYDLTSQIDNVLYPNSRLFPKETIYPNSN
ncbi:hypothetical protein [Clostridium sp.]|uniref:hypothetical protein n=1 Tax=Clostridium sp. TaxID=1506 RepID=UPI001A398B73|nr:hypothetical protein [Clostridium sp.]MBK5239841.1 hypothetical protein [Clostridium sp.]